MKKLVILFLLATVLVGFTFGQVSIKGGFELGNVNEGNKGKMDPTLFYVLDAAAATDLGPGQIGLHGQVPLAISFQNDFGSAYRLHGGDDFVIGGFYSLPAGPGTLKISLDEYLNDFGAANVWEPGLSYTGIEAGPATLGLGVWYDFVDTGSNKDGKKALLGKYVGGVYELEADALGFFLEAGIGPVGVTYKFVYGIGAKEVAKIAYLKVSYQATDQISAAVELDDTGKDFKGFKLVPQGSFAVSEKLALGLYVAIANIGNDAPLDEVQIYPGLWVKYTF